MKLTGLKNFLNPSAGKLVLLFIIDFLFTVILLLTSDSIGIWTYMLSPNSLYLESTVNLYTSSLTDIALNGAISNFIDIFYIYFLSCLIVAIYRKVRGK